MAAVAAGLVTSWWCAWRLVRVSDVSVRVLGGVLRCPAGLLSV
ncbi:MAG: hypothetical protein ACRDRH_12360 [Pseudonocardia sp.]